MVGEKDVVRLVCPSATMVLVVTGVEITKETTEVGEEVALLLLLLPDEAAEELLDDWDCCCATTRCSKKSSRKWPSRAIQC